MGSFLFPNTPTMHCKILGGDIWGCRQAGQSLVGPLLSDGTVRQGLDTSRQGGGERRGGREDRETRLWPASSQGPAFLGSLGRSWEREGRQLKPVGAGHDPHPHGGQCGQLHPLCWTELAGPWSSAWSLLPAVGPGMGRPLRLCMSPVCWGSLCTGQCPLCAVFSPASSPACFCCLPFPRSL